MLARLQAIGRGASGQRTESDAREEPAAARPLSAEDSVLLLIPTDGGMAFRLFSVESQQAAAAFVFQEYPTLAEKSLTFQPRAAPPGRYAGDDAEALVLVADDARPGMVFVSSFEAMEDAESFLRFEEKNGLDMSLVQTYWGVPQAIGKVAGPAPAAGTSEGRTIATVQPSAAVAPVPIAASPRATPAAKTRAAAAPSAAVPDQRESVIEAIRTWPGWTTLRARMIAASLLNNDFYHAIRQDPIASSQGRAIVGATAAAAAVGAFWFGPLAVISYAVLSLIGWLVCAHLTYLVGTKLFHGRRSAESQEWLFKSLAFAQAPRLLLIFGLALPGFGLLLALAMFVWALAASVPAAEETLEIDQQSALLSAMTGWLAMFALALALPLSII